VIQDVTQRGGARSAAGLSMAFTIGCLICFFSGCPDFSHLRDEPDYKNMSDSGDEAPEESSAEQE
jgi:hypothetical protein